MNFIEEKPMYKERWFWIGIGIIVIIFRLTRGHNIIVLGNSNGEGSDRAIKINV